MVSRSVCKALTMEFDTFRRRMRNGVIRGPRDGESSRVVRFGPESFELGVKTWRQIFMSPLLMWTLFGNDFCSLHGWEYREVGMGTGRRKLYHICSQRRLNKLLSLNGWSANAYDGDVGVQTFCGRVYVRRRLEDGSCRHQSGFVMEETERRIQCRLEDTNVVWIDKPKWVKDVGYQLNRNLNETFCIVQYDPVRILVSVDGIFTICYHRITLQYRSNHLVFE